MEMEMTKNTHQSGKKEEGEKKNLVMFELYCTPAIIFLCDEGSRELSIALE